MSSYRQPGYRRYRKVMTVRVIKPIPVIYLKHFYGIRSVDAHRPILVCGNMLICDHYNCHASLSAGNRQTH